jgi:hypothetical protein
MLQPAREAGPEIRSVVVLCEPQDRGLVGDRVIDEVALGPGRRWPGEADEG